MSERSERHGRKSRVTRVPRCQLEAATDCPPDEDTASDSTVLLCCSGSRSPAAVASLLVEHLTTFGAGLAHIPILC